MKKILIHLHIYYKEQTDMFAEKINSSLKGYDYDLFVTINELDEKIEQKFLAFKPDTKFIVVKNVGADIYPFIRVLNLINLEDYSYLIKLHTKKIYDKKDGYHRLNTFLGLRKHFWNKYLISFLSSQNIKKIIGKFEINEKLGITAHHFTIRKNVNADTNLKKEMLNLGLKKDVLKLFESNNFSVNLKDLQHVSGTIFFARAYIFNWVKQLNLSEADFKEYNKENKADTFILCTMEIFIGNCANASGLVLDDVFTAKLQKIIEIFINSINFTFFNLRKFFFRIDNKGFVRILKIPIFKLSA